MDKVENAQLNGNLCKVASLFLEPSSKGNPCVLLWSNGWEQEQEMKWGFSKKVGGYNAKKLIKPCVNSSAFVLRKEVIDLQRQGINFFLGI